MTAIFLTIITIGVLIFFGVNRSISKFLPNNRLKHATALGYFFQFFGLVGLIIYHVEFLDTPALQISIESNLPELIRAIAELSWPIAITLGAFWFLPQILDFFNDPGKSIPWVQALSGRGLTHNQQHFSKEVDIDKIPELSDAHKELMRLYESQLSNLSADEQKTKLLIHAADCELRANFASVYNIIFGSQIQALKTLVVNQNIDLMPFYQMHRERTENAKGGRLDSFNIWIQLLKSAGLVTEVSDKFSISSKGLLFLKFLKDRDYYLDKAF